MEKSLENAPRKGAGCVIMASGLGRRFGGNKLLADFGGEPLICRAFRATEGLFDARVVVTRHREVANLAREWGIAVVLHDLPLRSDTVRLGLQAVGEAAGCLFCPGDQPLLRRETVAELAAKGLGNPGTIWRPAFQGTPGSPVWFPRELFPELMALPPGKGGGFVAKQHPERLRTVAAGAEELQDVDSPEDLLRLLAWKTRR